MSRRFRNIDLILTRRILGESVSFSINANGEFSTHAGGEWITGETFKEVFTKARRALHRIRRKVAIPATAFGLREIVPGQYVWKREMKNRPYVQITITGINPKTGEVQAIEDATGEPMKADRWSRSDLVVCKRLTDAEAQRYIDLLQAKRKAEQEFDSYENKCRIGSLERVVKEELARTADDPNEGEDEETLDPR